MPYTVAIALIYGKLESQHFDDQYLRDPEVLATAARIKVAISEEADRHMPEAMRCHFTLVTKSGTKHTTMVDYHKGHYKNPMTETEIEGEVPTACRGCFAPRPNRPAARGAMDSRRAGQHP